MISGPPLPATAPALDILRTTKTAHARINYMQST
ncbi:unnamed protein product [Linum tenue]|uniref:Uncharacterized protein n=1 Tax=Linum tenue TaxID=586396 RepID=A0AAV0L926_9ROSI|nr:unnamed protein product [Linum tenue]